MKSVKLVFVALIGMLLSYCTTKNPTNPKDAELKAAGTQDAAGKKLKIELTPSNGFTYGKLTDQTSVYGILKKCFQYVNYGNASLGTYGKDGYVYFTYHKIPDDLNKCQLWLRLRTNKEMNLRATISFRTFMNSGTDFVYKVVNPKKDSNFVRIPLAARNIDTTIVLETSTNKKIADFYFAAEKSHLDAYSFALYNVLLEEL